MDIYNKIRIAEETRFNIYRWNASIEASIMACDRTITVEQICSSKAFLRQYISSIMSRLEPDIMDWEIGDTIYKVSDFPEQMQDLFNELNAHIGSVIRAFEGGDNKCM